ncbi:hypothetical protein R6258_06730 [Halomonas sp. HP20-15]|uniref:hypothetical protein n=1 Tax=Halomonas sp. HP20-15 TaxID=3085901 RepID=UPI0029817451|nr:hypothetical protein [Halomonas sp. HP20-15]MDW5376611.1 hypothetical protein [Halomonas sp. HP20-15]
MFRDDVPGCGVYRHTDGRLVKQSNMLVELLHGDRASAPETLERFLREAGYTAYETVKGVYTIYAPVEGAILSDAFRHAFEGVRYLIQVETDPKSHFFVLVNDSLVDYLSVLALLQPLAIHKRMAAESVQSADEA